MHWVRLEKYEFSRNGKWKLGWLSSMKNASQKRKVSSQLVEFKWSWKPCINGDLSLFMKGMCYVGVRLIMLQICFFFPWVPTLTHDINHGPNDLTCVPSSFVKFLCSKLIWCGTTLLLSNPLLVFPSLCWLFLLCMSLVT